MLMGDKSRLPGQKLAQTEVFMFLVTLTLIFDLCSIFCHTLIRIRPLLMGDIPRTYTQTHTHTKVKSIVSQIPSGLD